MKTVFASIILVLIAVTDVGQAAAVYFENLWVSQGDPSQPVTVGAVGLTSYDAFQLQHVSCNRQGNQIFAELDFYLPPGGHYDVLGNFSQSWTYSTLPAGSYTLVVTAYAYGPNIGIQGPVSKTMLFSLFPAEVAGDFNRNGRVDNGDYTIWADNFRKTPPSGYQLGNDPTGGYNDADYTKWADSYGCSVGMTVVPEPITLSSIVLGWGMIRRKRI